MNSNFPTDPAEEHVPVLLLQPGDEIAALSALRAFLLAEYINKAVPDRRTRGGDPVTAREEALRHALRGVDLDDSDERHVRLVVRFLDKHTLRVVTSWIERARAAAEQEHARVPWPAGWRYTTLRFGGLLPVAGVTAVVSYLHLAGLLRAYDAGWFEATIGPLAVDRVDGHRNVRLDRHEAAPGRGSTTRCASAHAGGIGPGQRPATGAGTSTREPGSNPGSAAARQTGTKAA